MNAEPAINAFINKQFPQLTPEGFAKAASELVDFAKLVENRCPHEHGRGEMLRSDYLYGVSLTGYEINELRKMLRIEIK